MIQINGVKEIAVLKTVGELAFIKVIITFNNGTNVMATLHKSVYETAKIALKLREQYGISPEDLNEFADAVQHQVRYEDFLKRMRGIDT